MDFSLQKKDLINLKNTIKSLNSKSNEGNQWVLNFSIVKLVSVWEQIIRSYADKSLSEINRNKLIKIEFDKKRLYEYVWKSWLDGKQQNLTDSFKISYIKHLRSIYFFPVHSYTFQILLILTKVFS
jgi:hypothetical protein